MSQMANKLEKGCTFGLVLQQKVLGMEEKLDNGFSRVENRLKSIEDKNIEMFNHMSSRPTREAARTDKITWMIIGGLFSIVMTLVGVLFYGAKVS